MNKIRTFDEQKHEYRVDDVKYRSVTELLGKHKLAPDYSMVDPFILQSKAEFGNRIHRAIEMYIKGLTQKENLNEIALSGVEVLEENNIIPIGSEYRVYLDQHQVAGTVDILALLNNENILVDIKTTYVLNKSALSWQLGFYKLLAKHFLGVDVKDGYCLWLNPKTSKFELVEVDIIDEKTILDLLEVDANNLIYGQEKENELIEVSQHLALHNILFQLEEAKEYVKHLEEQSKQVLDQLKEAMVDSGIKSFEDDNFKITYVAPQKRVRYDYKQYLEDNKLEITDDYKKVSYVNDSVRITKKEDK